MTVVQTVLIFVGIPALVFLVFGVVGMGRRPKSAGRYRLGEPWDGPALWFEGHPRPRATPPPVSGRAALTSGPTDDGGWPEQGPTLKGGASGSW